MVSLDAERAGSDSAIGFGRIDERGAFGRVALGEKLGDGNFAEARIAVVGLDVGVGELHGLDAGVEFGGAVRASGGGRELLHDVEHFEGGDAVAVGRQLVDGPIAIGGVHRLNPLGGVGSEIVGGHGAAEIV